MENSKFSDIPARLAWMEKYVVAKMDKIIATVS